MSHILTIDNKSPHNQEFEVHGWNNNHNTVVPAHSSTNIHAPDGSSGAIIALHDGHEGEQAEITKKGFGGNDFFDVSNITGAGGNITVEQKNDPETIKGHPLFMQALNNAWAHADEKTKDNIKRSLHFDHTGRIVRMDATKDNPHLEAFVHTFDKLSYVGVGSWNGNAGNAVDNAQSRAAHGSKDILITYSDGDARPTQPNVSDHRSAPSKEDHAAHAIGTTSHERAAPEVHPNAHPAVHNGMSSTDHDDGKAPGIILSNKSAVDETYYFYNNYWNGNGTAGANFDHPLKSAHVPAGHTVFVSLPSSFKGRVQRGHLIPATWVEFQIEASNDHKAHGDVSVEQGNDGPAMIHATDGTKSSNGFTKMIKAEGSAYQTRSDGKRVIASTMGNWLGGPNQAAIKAQQGIRTQAYVTGGTGVPDVASANRRLAVDFY
ncbi:hypothetical protein KCU64_g11099, partial [Aureobasidium melanogenum]